MYNETHIHNMIYIYIYIYISQSYNNRPNGCNAFQTNNTCANGYKNNATNIAILSWSGDTHQTCVLSAWQSLDGQIKVWMCFLRGSTPAPRVNFCRCVHCKWCPSITEGGQFRNLKGAGLVKMFEIAPSRGLLMI